MSARVLIISFREKLDKKVVGLLSKEGGEVRELLRDDLRQQPIPAADVVFLKKPPRFGSVLGGEHLVAPLLQVGLQDLGGDGLVLGEQHLHRASPARLTHGPRPAAKPIRSTGSPIAQLGQRRPQPFQLAFQFCDRRAGRAEIPVVAQRLQAEGRVPGAPGEEVPHGAL